MKKFVLLLPLFFLFSACGNEPAETQPTPTGKEFSPAALARAADYSRENGGSAVLVMQNGSILYENYHNGANENTATHLHSATKFFWAAVAALSLQQGLISNYDEQVAATLTEWQNSNLHPNKNLIRIHHLLSLSSGLSQDTDQIQGTDYDAEDIYRYVVDSLDLRRAPGSAFVYGPSHYYVFGVLLERKLHASGRNLNPLEYLETEIFDKIGLEYAEWVHDPSGNPHIPNGCYITPRNWAKFGQFMLQKGQWQGSQIIESRLMEELFEADGPNLGHGKFCWLNNLNGTGAAPNQIAPAGSQGGFIYHDGYTEIIGGLGAGKNRMYLVPSLNAVIIRQTLMENDGFQDTEFLDLILPK
jgi:CubicO group peptidase (beta-lactamase class C family)